ncbi:hypothetical protein [Mesorhizobium sp. A556]
MVDEALLLAGSGHWWFSASILQEGDAAMQYAAAARAGFQEARSIYEGGYKSVNKLHLKDSSDYRANLHNYKPIDIGFTLDEIEETRENKLLSANDTLSKIRAFQSQKKFGALVFGELLIKVKASASNCHELALMAAASAWSYLGKSQPPSIALASLVAPADHIFCVVGPRAKCSQLDGRTIGSLAESSAAIGVWAADPWLNVLCELPEYAALADAKFDKWHMANKRIAWAGGPQGSGWYPAMGDYSKGFAAATLEVDLC